MTKPASHKYSSFHPITLLCTWFWSGFAPKAPGTFGTIAAVPLGVVLMTYGGQTITILCAVLLFGAGVWCSERYVGTLKDKDPSYIVIDEVAAFIFMCAFIEINALSILLSFILFRIFDIIKPFPIKILEHKFTHDGFGIMIDDMFAVLYAFISYHIIIKLSFNIFHVDI